MTIRNVNGHLANQNFSNWLITSWTGLLEIIAVDKLETHWSDQKCIILQFSLFKSLNEMVIVKKKSVMDLSFDIIFFSRSQLTWNSFVNGQKWSFASFTHSVCMCVCVFLFVLWKCGAIEHDFYDESPKRGKLTYTRTTWLPKRFSFFFLCST